MPPSHMHDLIFIHFSIGNIQTFQVQELEYCAESESLLSQDKKKLDF